MITLSPVMMTRKITDSCTTTNIALYSQRIGGDDGAGDGYFTRAGSTAVVATLNDTTAPDSTTTASKIVGQTGASGSRMDGIFSSMSAQTIYTFSIYAKAGGFDRLSLSALGYGFNFYSNVELTTGTWTDSQDSDIISRDISDEGNGWYRLSVVFKILDTTSGGIDINFTDTPNSVDGIYLWGAQVEVHEGVTAYKATTSVPVEGAC